MQGKPDPTFTLKRSVWLGVLVGCLAQLALNSLLPILVFVALNLLSLATGGDAIFEPDARHSSGTAWLIEQCSMFAASILAGSLAAVLSPPRAVMVPVALAILSLLMTAFRQIPMPYSAAHVAVWTAGPCIGVVIGVLAMRRLLRSAG